MVLVLVLDGDSELTLVSVKLCACENGNIVCSATGEDREADDS